MKVGIDDYNGLKADLVCVGHDEEGCGVVEAFLWDNAASMENYHGERIELAEFPIEITEISEDNGFVWRLPVEGEKP